MRHKSIKIFINYFLGPLLFIWLSWSIYREIKQQRDLDKAWQHILEAFRGPLLWNLAAVIVLMFINWAIEAFKWKLAIRAIQQVSFAKAFRAVLSGVSFSVSTPNRMGEYLGRILYMNEGNRLKAISLTIVCSMSQLIITLLAGSIGLMLLWNEIETVHIVSSVWMRFIISGVVIVLVTLTLFYFRLNWLVKWGTRIPAIRRYNYLIKTLEDFNATRLLQLLSLSAIRFLVFIVQYYLLFSLFDVQIQWWQAFWTVSISFLVLAVIPSFAIADLGLRGKVALTMIGLFSANNLGIWMATMVIWLVNLIIPAIIGSLLILSIKRIFTNKNVSANPGTYPNNLEGNAEK